MKKISTLAVALITMGSLATSAWAQAVEFTPVSSIDASGWYQIRQVKGVNNKAITTEAPRYVFSAETANNYTWFGTADEPKTDATAFVWVDKTSSDYAIQSLNGQWGKSKGEKSKGGRAGFQIKVKDAIQSTFTIGDYWDDWASFNGYMGGSSGSGNAAFQFSKVTSDQLSAYDVYKVIVLDGNATSTVQCSIAENKGLVSVFNGGHFFVTSETDVKASDFTASAITNCTYNVKVDASAKTVTVIYGRLDMDARISEAEKYLAEKGIGSPIEGADSRKSLQAAIDVAKKENTVTNYNALVSERDKYLNSDKDIQMPENGKAYTFTMVTKAGKKWYMNYEQSGYTLKETTAEDNKDYPQTATLICHKLSNGKYVFLNNAGKYFIFKGVNNASKYNENKGYSDKYEEVNYTTGSGASVATKTLYPQQVTIAKLKNGDYSETPNGLYVYAASNRYTANDKIGVFVMDKNGGYSAAEGAAFFNDNYTSAIKIEEVTYPNKVTFNPTGEDIAGVSHIATFSAPFATIVPDGVKAWYVDDEDGNKATLKALEEGKAIPANQGVLLTSESGTGVTMVPVADEAQATITSNKLKASAGADKTLEEIDNAYILGKSAGKVAFYKGKVGSKLGMNKAYLEHAAGVAAIALDFNIGVTRINNAVATEALEAPIFDLSGRRVANTIKGGFYIQGGKKFIAQ